MTDYAKKVCIKMPLIYVKSFECLFRLRGKKQIHWLKTWKIACIFYFASCGIILYIIIYKIR